MRGLMFFVAVSVAVGASGCDQGGEGAAGDSTSRFERGMERVGKQIETAAEGVGTEVFETRVQMILDNIKGMDSVQAQVTGEGTITLIGAVATDAGRTEAERLVRSIEGVNDVRNAIEVGGVGAGPVPGETTPGGTVDSGAATSRDTGAVIR